MNRKNDNTNESMLMMNQTTRSALPGHLAALFTALVWGCTFIASKILLEKWTPVEILFLRFLLGFIMLILIHPKKPRHLVPRQELYLIGAGLTGVTGYYLLENVALTYTLPSVVSVITCTAPFFTAISALLFLKKNKLTRFFFAGFFFAIAGICLISFSGAEVAFNLTGTFLALAAAMVWGVYSILVEKSSETGLSTIEMTQRFFFYGLLFMLPLLRLMDFSPDLSQIFVPRYMVCLLFLGFVASGLCFVTWNLALSRLGTVEAGVYIYLVPVITMIVSALVIGEKITASGLSGMILTLAGLILSHIRR